MAMIVYETTAPAINAYAVTASDTLYLKESSRALFIGNNGDIKVDMVGEGAAIVFENVADGTILPIQVRRVYDTDTTASGIVALV